MLLSHGPHMFSILISNDVDHGDHHGSARLHWTLWANGFRTGIAIHLNQLELSFERMYIRYTSDTKVCRDVQSLHPHGQLELLFPYLDLKKTWAGYQKTQKDYVTIYIYIMMQESVFKSRNQTQPWLQPSNRSNRSYRSKWQCSVEASSFLWSPGGSWLPVERPVEPTSTDSWHPLVKIITKASQMACLAYRKRTSGWNFGWNFGWNHDINLIKVDPQKLMI